MKTYILAFDIGTSGTKAVLFDTDGTLSDSETVGYDTYYPAPDCAEQDAKDWYAAVTKSSKALIERTSIKASQIEAISFSAQMMGALALDVHGEPLRRSLIWADNRSEAQAKRLGEKIGRDSFYKIAGARPSASYTGSKIMWLKENEPEIYEKTSVIMQAKDYIIYRLTGEIVTDYSDAAGSNLFDVTKKEWSHTLIEAAGIKKSLLPDAFPSTHIAGRVTANAAAETGLCEGIPVVIGSGDGACASVGAGAWKNGQLYCCIGSSAWISMASVEPNFDKDMQTFNIVHPDGKMFAPNCPMQAAGYSLNRLRSLFFGGEKTSYDTMTAEAALSPAAANGLVYMPYLMGERCPRWNTEAYGGLMGMTLKTSRGDIIRAVMEGVAMNLRAILNIFGRFAYKDGHATDIIMIGGGAKSELWLQIIADSWKRRVTVPRDIGEATSIGAAIIAGVGVGLYKDFGVCETFNRTARTIEPKPENYDVYDALFEVFNDFYEDTRPMLPRLTEIKQK